MSSTIPAADRDTLRRLASDYRDICASPRNQELQRRWYAHNALAPGEPLVVCDPEGAWTDILGDWGSDPARSLVSDPRLRGAEWQLRSRLYVATVLKDDRAWAPHLNVGWRVDHGDFGVRSERQHGANRGSFTWTAPITDLATAPQVLRHRRPRVDREATRAEVGLLGDLVGDILPVRIRSGLWWTCGLTIDVIALIGLERLMTAMIDEPEALHALMAWMRDEQLAYGAWFEHEGLCGVRNQDDGIASGGQGWSRELPDPVGRPAGLRDDWGFAESQETVGVGPRMFAEFILPYQVPLLNRFGLACYGCCEGLERRIAMVRNAIPRLRRASVAPWADQAAMAQALGRQVIFSRKPNPAHVCAGFNEAAVRADLRSTLAVAGDCQLEIIMKDTHTVEGDLTRLPRWVQIAREEIAERGRAGHRLAG